MTFFVDGTLIYRLWPTVKFTKGIRNGNFMENEEVSSLN